MRQFTSDEIRDFVSMPRFDEQKLLCKDESWPKISIVTPSYKQGQFLERTILSVLNQNYPNLEYIIMDGGSTDGSVEIIRKYEKYLAHWCSEKDAGQSDAIRNGIRMSTGDVLAYLNSDDLYLPGVLRLVGAVFRSRPSVHVVYGNRYLTDEEDRIVGERRLVPCYIPCFARIGMIYGGFGIYQPASFWRRAIYYDAGEMDDSFVHCMDNDLFVRLLLRGAKFQFVREYLAGFRVHRASKTSNLSCIAEMERATIRDRYTRNSSRVLSWINRQFLRAVRVGSYLVQGDGFYLLKRQLSRELPWVP